MYHMPSPSAKFIVSYCSTCYYEALAVDHMDMNTCYYCDTPLHLFIFSIVLLFKVIHQYFTCQWNQV